MIGPISILWLQLVDGVNALNSASNIISLLKNSKRQKSLWFEIKRIIVIENSNNHFLISNVYVFWSLDLTRMLGNN